MEFEEFLKENNNEVRTSFHIIKFDIEGETITIYDPNQGVNVVILKNEEFSNGNYFSAKFNLIMFCIQIYYGTHSEITNWTEAVVNVIYNRNFISFF